MKKTILLLGSSGFLGSSLVPILKKSKYRLITHSLTNNTDFNVNLSIRKDVFDLLSEAQPDLIVNLVALTDVDLCEKNPKLAFSTNVQAVVNITDYIASKTKNIHLIQISTDQVYDNEKKEYNLEENIKITNVYAFSKLMAEIIASKVPSTILRTNFFGKSKIKNKRSLTDWAHYNLKNNLVLRGFDNVYFNPLTLNTLSSIILNLIDKKPTGIYNAGSSGSLTKADFIIYFAKCLNLSIENILKMPVEKVLSDGAYRPRNMLMDTRKLENYLNFKLPDIYDEITHCAQEYLWKRTHSKSKIKL